MSKVQTPYFVASVFWKLCSVYDHIVVHAMIRYLSINSNDFWDALRDLLDASGLLYSVLSEELEEEINSTSLLSFCL